MDIEIVGAVAPGSNIVIYFTPNTARGFVDAINTAIHDPRNKPAVVAISWNAAEPAWTDQTVRACDQAFADARHMGVTVCAASGDQGSSGGVGDGLSHVCFPASDPYVLGCGGTRLTVIGGVRSEVVWDAEGGASGGGVSDIFDRPSWQGALAVPPSANPGGRVGRGVPDVAGNADPATGYLVRVHGQDLPMGGTSAAAPLWAGLIALLNDALGSPAGYLNPLLYQRLAGAGAFNDIIAGNNGAYAACKGWDPCTGLGTPDATKLLYALGGRPGG
jgi:kumamolisin